MERRRKESNDKEEKKKEMQLTGFQCYARKERGPRKGREEERNTLFRYKILVEEEGGQRK